MSTNEKEVSGDAMKFAKRKWNGGRRRQGKPTALSALNGANSFTDCISQRASIPDAGHDDWRHPQKLSCGCVGLDVRGVRVGDGVNS